MLVLAFSLSPKGTYYGQTGKDEYDSSKKEDETQHKATGTVFQGLRADIDGYVWTYYNVLRPKLTCYSMGSAHIFIVGGQQTLVDALSDLVLLSVQGHATAQTTGLGGHMSTRFIPTVERESIDLVCVSYEFSSLIT